MTSKAVFFVSVVSNSFRSQRTFRFNGTTPCFCRALRFSVVKNTTEAKRSRRFTENTQGTKNHEIHKDEKIAQFLSRFG